MEVEQQLQQAIGTGEILRIIYYGGSYPGNMRDILPLKIDGGRLFAKCMVSNRQKTFSIGKIKFPEEKTTDAPVFQPPPPVKYETIAAILDINGEELRNKGWNIDSNDEVIEITGHFKNGKIKKTPSAILSFEEFTTANVWDDSIGDFKDEITGKRTKPWVVRIQKKTTRSFGTLNKAALYFLEMLKN